MKINSVRVVTLFLLVALSVGFGFAFDGVLTAIEKKNHPMPKELSETVSEISSEYALPEAVIYAVMKAGSDLQSNYVSKDGNIGLMQLSPERYQTVYETVFKEEAPDTGMLYSPEENIKCGAAWLSHLYERYGVWQVTFAAYFKGQNYVDAWLTDADNLTTSGKFKKIPDSQTATFVTSATDALEVYTRLYFE